MSKDKNGRNRGGRGGRQQVFGALRTTALRAARAVALQVLYGMDLNPMSPAQAMKYFGDRFGAFMPSHPATRRRLVWLVTGRTSMDDGDEVVGPLEAAVQDFYLGLVLGVVRRRLGKGASLDEFWRRFPVTPDADEQLRTQIEATFKQAAALTEQLVSGTWDAMDYLDTVISKASHNWRLNRMSVVDRNILRLGAYEVSRMEDIPPRVTLNEAVELAKMFGSSRSRAFVNGVMDRVVRELAPAQR